TRLFFKADAGKVLEQELARPGYVCKPITIGANTDPYQPDERQMKVTRSILEVLTRARHPVSLITKGALILRDLDLLTDLAKDQLVTVAVSITTLDNGTKRVMEPRAASPEARLRAVRELNEAGVPTGVMVAPVVRRRVAARPIQDCLQAPQPGLRWARDRSAHAPVPTARGRGLTVPARFLRCTTVVFAVASVSSSLRRSRMHLRRTDAVLVLTSDATPANSPVGFRSMAPFEPIQQPQLRKQFQIGGNHQQSRNSADDHGRHGAEPARGDAGFEFAELVRSADEHRVDRAHAAADLIGSLQLNEHMPNINAEHVARAEHRERRQR